MLTVTQAAGKFLAWCKSARDEKTADFYERTLRGFTVSFGCTDLAALTPAAVEQWTRNYHQTRSVVRLCTWATHEAKILEKNPVQGMPLPDAGARQRVLGRRDRVKLKRAAAPAFRRFLIGLDETFARPGELRAVEWSQIRTDGNHDATPADIAAGRAFFRLDRFKGRSRRKDRRKVRIVPISPRLGRLLCRCGGVVGQVGHVFLNSDGRPWTGNACRCAMRKLREAAGIVADADGERVVCYTFRHSGATDAVRNGLRDFRLAELLGHASPRTTERYVHLAAGDVRQALAIARGRPAKGPAGVASERPT